MPDFFRISQAEKLGENGTHVVLHPHRDERETMSRPLPPPPLTAAEVAPLLRISPYAVTLLCKTGKLRATKPGREWLIDAESFHEYLEAGRPDTSKAAS